MSAVWIVGFFSVSKCKLPTYVLPSFPSICLLFGHFLDRRVFAHGLRIDLSQWTLRVPVRATRFMTGLVALGGIACVGWLGRTSMLAICATIAATALLATLAWLAGRPQVSRTVAWSSFIVSALLTLGLANCTLIPAVSSWHSIHRALLSIRNRAEFADVPLVFYCHESYGSSIWLGDDRYVEFDDGHSIQMRDFLVQQRRALIVSRDEPVEILQNALPWPLAITRIPGTRHLYLCAERGAVDHEPRVASRYDPKTAVWH